MQKFRINKIIFLGTVLFLIASCGKKQKNFLIFPDEPTVKINKLDLPSVRNICIHKNHVGTQITWSPIFSDKTPQSTMKFKPNLVGYDIFRLTNGTIIPQNPINKKPISENYFIDTKKNLTTAVYYTIKPLFRFKNQELHGPSSQIVKISI